jgi:hypothetical protein
MPKLCGTQELMTPKKGIIPSRGQNIPGKRYKKNMFSWDFAILHRIKNFHGSQ